MRFVNKVDSSFFKNRVFGGFQKLGAFPLIHSQFFKFLLFIKQNK
jgi:hypothetical protein